MSRGHGATQRRLLEQLTAEHQVQLQQQGPWIRLVDMVGRNAPPAIYESSRRALYRLRQQGVVQIFYLINTETGYPRRYLAARITSSAAVRSEQNCHEQDSRAAERDIKAKNISVSRDVSVGIVQNMRHPTYKGKTDQSSDDVYIRAGLKRARR